MKKKLLLISLLFSVVITVYSQTNTGKSIKTDTTKTVTIKTDTIKTDSIKTITIKTVTIKTFTIKTDTVKKSGKGTDGKAKTDTVKYWRTGGFYVLNFNEARFKYWSAGGENAFSATGLLNLFADYKKKSLVWDNALDLRYGLMMLDHNRVRKNEDKIELSSKLGLKAFNKFYYSALLDYQTQFDKGYNYPNDSVVMSRFNAPGYISLGLGLDYKLKDYLSISISPATGKLTFVLDKALSDSGYYGVDRGKQTRVEFGANLNAKFQKDIFKNINLVAKLILFNNYTDINKANRKNIDVNSEIMLNIKAGKYLTTSILADLVYDQNIVARTQLKQVFGIGLSYKF